MDFKADIGIIGALEGEVAGIISRLLDSKSETFGSIEIHTGTLFGKRVAVARCGVGKVFAAIAAEAMILYCSPRLLVNTGVGGALAGGLKTCDVVFADKLVQHDMDTSPLGDPKGLISGINLVYFESDKRAVDILKKAAEKEEVNYLVGTVATGDKFVASKEDKEKIVSDFSAVACEMEGGAIAHTAYVNSTPFVVVRAISDSADGEATMDYPTFLPLATRTSEKLTLALIEEY